MLLVWGLVGRSTKTADPIPKAAAAGVGAGAAPIAPPEVPFRFKAEPDHHRVARAFPTPPRSMIESRAATTTTTTTSATSTAAGAGSSAAAAAAAVTPHKMVDTEWPTAYQPAPFPAPPSASIRTGGKSTQWVGGADTPATASAPHSPSLGANAYSVSPFQASVRANFSTASDDNALDWIKRSTVKPVLTGLDFLDPLLTPIPPDFAAAASGVGGSVPSAFPAGPYVFWCFSVC